MGVSTRGIRFKFYVGETVLCYEPDPTKAKVLYESRVLDLVAGSDHRGKKRAEYLIHFLGWNSSWDRCVAEECILPFSDENRELQIKLAKDAAVSIKGRRLTLIKDEPIASPKPQVKTDASDTSEDEEEEKEVVINIPDVLKAQLEEDWRNINKRNKLVAIPCFPNVVGILEAFVQRSASSMLRPPEDTALQDKLGMYKEAVDGVRVIFDFNLSRLLLYGPERRQLGHRDIKVSLKVESESDCPPTEPITIKQEEPPSPAKPIGKRGRPSLRQKVTPKVVENGIKQVETTSQVLVARKRKRGRPKAQPLRALRSQLKPPSGKKPNNSSTKTRAKRKLSKGEGLKEEAGPSGRSLVKGEEPIFVGTLKQEAGPSSETRVLRRRSSHAPETHTVPPCSDMPLPSPSSSSNHESSNGGAGLNLSWRMLPTDVRERVPPEPSLVYGAQHLLRLFVRLPDLISRMRIPDRRRLPLLNILDQLLTYLCEQKEHLFPPSAYMDSPNDISQ